MEAANRIMGGGLDDNDEVKWGHRVGGGSAATRCDRSRSPRIASLLIIRQMELHHSLKIKHLLLRLQLPVPNLGSSLEEKIRD
jgi:hypothetical protein